MNKFKIMLLFMSLLVVGMAIISFSALLQNDDVVIINSSVETQTVEYSLTEMSNGLEVENLTEGSYLRYFTIPRHANVTKAVFNISGLNFSYEDNLSYQEDSDESFITIVGSNPWTGYLYVNYTKIEGSKSAIWTVKHGLLEYDPYNITIPSDCWDYDSTKLVLRINSIFPQYGQGYQCSSRPFCFNSTDWEPIGILRIDPTMPGAIGFQEQSALLIDGDWDTGAYVTSNDWATSDNANKNSSIWEEAIWWNVTDYSSFPYNVTIDFGNNGSSEFNTSGAYGIDIFNTTNQTIDFNIHINNYLAINSNCSEDLDAEKSYSSDCSEVEPLRPFSQAFDEDWGTYGLFSSGGSCSIFWNYTIPLEQAKRLAINITTSLQWQAQNAECDMYCKNNTNDWEFFITPSNTGQDTNVIPPSCYTGKTNVQLRCIVVGTGLPSYQIRFSEDKLVLIQDKSACDGNINFPVSFVIPNAEININAINITYNLNLTHLYILNNSYSWNESTIGMTPNTKYKRRYKIQPTSNVASNNISLSGYYLNFSTADKCEINNTPYTPTSSYCPFNFNVTQGQYWNTHYIWDSNISINYSINMSNVSTLSNDILYQNFSIFFRDANDLGSEASSGVYVNSTLGWYYNSTIGQGEKFTVYISGTAYDITPSSTQGCPDYERKTASTKVYYTCLNRTEKYASVIIESN